MMKAMILAAGFGKRMLPLTETRPKPLLEVDSKALIVHIIERLAKAGFKELVINTAYLGQQIEWALGDGEKFGVSIEYSKEFQPLETGGAIVKALPLLGEAPFLLVNGDIFTDYPFEQLRESQPKFAHLVLASTPSYRMSGDFDLADSYCRNSESPEYTYTGVGVYNPKFFTDDLSHMTVGDSFALGPELRKACEHSAVTGEFYAGQWHDIGTPQRLEELNQLQTNIKNNDGSDS